jgi:hypothetical protein
LGARPDQEAVRALAAMRWRSPSGPAPYSAARNPIRHKACGFEMASQLIYTERASRLAFATGFSHTAQLRPPAPQGSCAHRRATLFSRSRAAQSWSGAVIGGPVPDGLPHYRCASGMLFRARAVAFRSPHHGGTSTTVGGTRSCRAARSARHPVKVEVAGSNPVRTAGIPGEISLGSQPGQVAQSV